MLENMTTFELIYMSFAVFGGVCFIGILALQFIGIGDGIDSDGGLDTGLDGQLDTGPDLDSDASFKLLSFQGLVAFSLMFGLVGLAASIDEWGQFPAFASAVGAGLVSIWIIGKIFSFAASLQSSGTQQIGNLVGLSATVYTRIPADGTGKITVTVNNRLNEFMAKSADGSEIQTSEPVEIVEVLDTSTVLVKRK